MFQWKENLTETLQFDDFLANWVMTLSHLLSEIKFLFMRLKSGKLSFIPAQYTISSILGLHRPKAEWYAAQK